jgi:NADH:ubiquinone reductase (H+-translocating)
VTNDFGTPGVTKYTVPLETPAQANRFNRRLVNACLRARTQTEPVRPGHLNVAIVGAGATGTELAAELHRTIREVIGYGLDRIDPQRDVRVVLIERAPHIRPELPDRIASETNRMLDEMGVDVRTGVRVTEVSADGVKLADGSFIPSELVVWAAGVKAPEVLRRLDGLETNRTNQLVVNPTLQTRGIPTFSRSGTAPTVRVQAHPRRYHLARRRHIGKHRTWFVRLSVRTAPLRQYAYRDFGSLVSFGKRSTVGNLMGFLSGRSFFVERLFARTM